MHGSVDVPEDLQAWSKSTSGEFEERAWTTDAVNRLDAWRTNMAKTMLERVEKNLLAGVKNQTGLSLKELDMDWLYSGELSYHHDEVKATEHLYFCWFVHISEPATLEVDRAVHNVNAGDWFAFDAHNIHRLRKKSSSSDPLKVVFGLGSIPLTKQWREKVGVRLIRQRGNSFSKRASFPEYCENTGVVL